MIRVATAADRAWAAARHAAIGFAPTAPDDLLLVVVVDGEPAGVGRVVGGLELGGMYVDPAHRGRGLAEALVAALVAQAPGPRLWCVPFTPLEALYRRAGFADPRPDDPVPPPIAAKVAWCRGRYPDPVSLLVRDVEPA